MTTDVDPSAAEFGKYRLLRKLAQGGMAEIFLAIQTGIQGFEKVVVVKRVLPDLSASDDFINMFLDEARIAARLDHTNIVRIYDLGEVNGQYFIAMEYIAGEDLASVLQQCKRQNTLVPIELAVDAVLGAAEALLFAHELEDNEGNLMNLVHRDVSPSNILLTYQGTVKLVDFGIARAESNVSKTQGGQLKGKIQYLSPEQCRGAVVDCRSDIFALGIVLHELLTCKRLFQRDTQLAAMNAILSGDIAPPSALRPEIPAELDAIVMKALERDLDLRYQTAGQLAADLTVFLMHREYSRTGKFVEFLTRLFGEERKRAKLRVAKGLKLDDVARPPSSVSGSFPAVPGSGGRPTSSPRLSTGDIAPVRASAPRLGQSGLTARPPSGSGPIRPPSSGSGPIRPPSGSAPVRPPSQVSGHLPLLATPPPAAADPDEALTSVADSSLQPNPVLGTPVEGLAGLSRKKQLQLGALGFGVVALLIVAVVAVTQPKPQPVLVEAPPIIAVKPVEPLDPAKKGKPDLPENPRPAPGLQVGGVRFEGVPAGSRITIDGNPVGNPAADSFVACGKHAVLVDAKGFLPFETMVEITVGNVVSVKAVLRPRPVQAQGIIDIACQPWCMISIDNRDTGKTSPARISVPVGTHTLLLSNAPAGLAKKITVTVGDNAVVKKVVQLDE